MSWIRAGQAVSSTLHRLRDSNLILAFSSHPRCLGFLNPQEQASLRTAQMPGVRGESADAVVSQRACLVDIALATAASDGSFAAIVVGDLDAAFLSVLLSMLADGIVGAAVGCTGEERLLGSAHTPVGIEDCVLVV